MAFKVFFDINILIDLLDKNRLNHQDAITIVRDAEEGNINGFVSESVLNTTAYLIRKDFSTKQIIQLVNHLLSFVQVIPINTISYLSGLQRTINDIEDSILYSAALHEGLDFFITNDIKDFKKIEIAALPVIQARELHKHL